jgi:hypothetical protein
MHKDKSTSRGRWSPGDAIVSPRKPGSSTEGGQSFENADADRARHMKHFTGGGRLVDKDAFRRREGAHDD